MPSSACSVGNRLFPCFPTRRSSDLHWPTRASAGRWWTASRRPGWAPWHPLRSPSTWACAPVGPTPPPSAARPGRSWRPTRPTRSPQDRKSTRLNSSHLGISYAVFCLFRWQPTVSLFPYTTLFRSALADAGLGREVVDGFASAGLGTLAPVEVAEYLGLRPSWADSTSVGGSTWEVMAAHAADAIAARSEEHTSELQSLRHLVCRLLLVPLATDCFPVSLHDALPICTGRRGPRPGGGGRLRVGRAGHPGTR